MYIDGKMKHEKNFGKNISLSKFLYPAEVGLQNFQFARSDSFHSSNKTNSLPLGSDDDIGAKCNFHFFHLYMKSGYYVGVIPYNPVFTKEKGRYILETNKIHTFLCFIFYILAVLNRLSILRSTWQTSGLHPTIFYFNLAHAHSHLILNLLFYFLLFTKSTEFQAMIDTIGHCPLLYITEGFKLRWAILLASQVCWVIMGFLAPFVGYDVINSWDWNPTWLYRSYVSKSKFTFLLMNNATLSHVPPELDKITGWETVLAGIQFMTILTHELQTRYLITGVGIACFTIWVGAKNFTDHVVPDDVSSNEGNEAKENAKGETILLLRSMMNGFGHLRTLADAVNKPWHLLCVWYMFDITVWLATDLDKALRTNDWFIKAHIFYFLFYTGTAITLSSESFRKMHWFRQWLHNRSNWSFVWRDRKQVKLLHQEVVESTVGIGVAGFYQIDYAFLSHVSVMIVTFFIISLQYAKF